MKILDEDTIIIQIDEWVDKIEITQEGAFLHIGKDVKEDVIDYMIKMLRGGCAVS